MASELTCWRGETLYLDADIQRSPADADFRVRRYRVEEVITEHPSWSGACVGAYGDVLSPVSSAAEPASISAIHVHRHTQPGVKAFTTAAGQELQITVLDAELPVQRLFPFYAEVNSNDCRLAYKAFSGASDAASYQLQGALTRHAIQVARDFGIEPVKQSIVWFEDTTTSEERIRELMTGPDGYINLVLAGAIAPPILWCGTSTAAPLGLPPPFFLQEINKLAPPGTMAWCADEPSWNGMGSGMAVKEAVRRVKDVHAHAPALIPMITTGTGVLPALQEEAMLQGVDVPITYCIVQNHDDPGLLANTTKGSYFSCMAQGCGLQPSPRTTFPVAVIEGHPTVDFERAITLAHDNHASFVLYYKITKNLTTCWEPGGLYNKEDGGNGDGTAMYVNKETGLVIPSIRMMRWHIAQQQVEKLLAERPPDQAAARRSS